ncbi:putative thiazole biosynthetic enzyme [Ruminiclostridium hungatei]|uniref:Putative thiazole biosynthetic enzyme n=1 Tax=Ruminiclostridium hungatei TaxID=48256 RepID=A0A1V4SML8_RUMHU|nr:FAD-dependent oxidoreductase [Ruminiclostridium hungatei]OPX45110.1 putative thiazole biosynthetic enzyme [Ruminiclostridium hungatei]
MPVIKYSKNLTAIKHYDVIVAGGGPAGICAAVAAAREGVSVALVERNGVLGGNMTAGHAGPILGEVAPGGMRDELMGLLGVPHNHMPGVVGLAHDAERARHALTNFVNDAGVEVYLQSPVSDVIMEDNRVRGVVITGKRGMYALAAEVTVDATGDGDVAFFSGAQSVCLHRTVTPRERRVNTTQESRMAETLGVCETRRFIGEYVLKDEDLAAGKKFDDAIVHNANFIADIHNPEGEGQAEGVPEEVKPYDIPYRCFIPLKTENLILAGRCISGTHRAHASYRVMTICMAMGQGTGIAAALAAKSNIAPRDLSPALVRDRLIDLGVKLEA